MLRTRLSSSKCAAELHLMDDGLDELRAVALLQCGLAMDLLRLLQRSCGAGRQVGEVVDLLPEVIVGLGRG
jgi:hypothetical protein